MTKINTVVTELSSWLSESSPSNEAREAAELIVVGLTDCAKRKTKIHPTILRGIAEYVEQLARAVGR